MFGIGALKQRVTRLEKMLDKMQQEKDCKEGRHVYEVCIHSSGDIPHARCQYCYSHPYEIKSKGGKS